MSQRFFEAAQHAAVYAKFRPVPPKQLGDRIISFLKERYLGTMELAIDVGCGNGQSSSLFSTDFQKVLATDISAAQIEVAKTLDNPFNIEFIVSPAEKIPAESGSAQIVSATQACHWFNLPDFFQEVDRVLSPNGIVVLSGYTFPQFVHTTKALELHKAFDLFYKGRTGPYWGSGRDLVDNEYRDINIPYQDAKREEFWSEEISLTLEEFSGYQTSWSGYQNFVRKHGDAAGEDILKEFIHSCQNILETQQEPQEVHLKMRRKYFLLMGRKQA